MTVQVTLVSEGLKETAAAVRKLARTLPVEALDRAMAESFADATEKVHVVSGRLKASGELHTEADEDGWHGSMSWGGDGVQEAIFEASRGGFHDWLRDDYLYGDAIEDALRTWPDAW